MTPYHWEAVMFESAEWVQICKATNSGEIVAMQDASQTLKPRCKTFEMFLFRNSMPHFLLVQMTSCQNAHEKKIAKQRTCLSRGRLPAPDEQFCFRGPERHVVWTVQVIWYRNIDFMSCLKNFRMRIFWHTLKDGPHPFLVGRHIIEVCSGSLDKGKLFAGILFTPLKPRFKFDTPICLMPFVLLYCKILADSKRTLTPFETWTKAATEAS